MGFINHYSVHFVAVCCLMVSVRSSNARTSSFTDFFIEKMLCHK